MKCPACSCDDCNCPPDPSNIKPCADIDCGLSWAHTEGECRG